MNNNNFSNILSYDVVCAFEEASLLKRFIPYSIGSPKESRTFDDQYNRANLVFFTDSHVDFRNPGESIDNVRRTITFVNNSPVAFDAVIHTGDIITPWGIKKTEAAKQANIFFDIVKDCKSPFVFSKGNHDLNDWRNYPSEVFTDTDWGNMFLDYAEEKYGIIRQTKKSSEKSTWHYLDLDEHKIRIISVDAQDTDKTTVDDEGFVKYYGGKSFYISEEQIRWIIDVALNFDEKEEKDWGVILAFHQIPADKPEYQNSVTELIRICAAFNTQSVYTNKFVCDTNSFFNWDVTADFTRYSVCDKKPHIICFLIGHDHVDKAEVRDGINLIWTANGSATTDYSDARLARVLGTSTQNCFDILNIDTRKRKIRMFRYGAGVNCYGIGGDRFLPDGLSY